MNRNRKLKSRDSESAAPYSSHPEAESGLGIVRPISRSLSPRNQPCSPPEVRKPIVSIHGRDVEEIPDTREQKLGLGRR